MMTVHDIVGKDIDGVVEDVEKMMTMTKWMMRGMDEEADEVREGDTEKEAEDENMGEKPDRNQEEEYMLNNIQNNKMNWYRIMHWCMVQPLTRHLRHEHEKERAEGLYSTCVALMK